LRKTTIIEEQKMSLQTSKLLGGIGAVTIFLSVFIIFTATTLVGTIAVGCIGSTFILISFYNFAKIYKDKKIFTNTLYGTLTTIIGAIITLTLIVVTPILSTLKDYTYRYVPRWSGNWTDLSEIYASSGSILRNTINACSSWILLVAIVFWVFLIIAMIFMQKSLKKLAQHSHNDTFENTGTILIVGAITPLIGLAGLWLSTLILTFALFTTKKPTITTLPPSTIKASPTPQTIPITTEKLQTTNLLGCAGALLIFLSAFTFTATFGFTIFIGSLLVLISLYRLNKIYRDKEILTNTHYGVLSTISGVITVLILIIATPILSTLKNSIYHNIPDWNGNLISLLNASSKWGSIFNTTWRQCGEWILLILIVFWVFLIIAMIFMQKTMKKLAQHSHNDTFTTTGTLLIIGAALPIIGLIVLWISTLTLAQAFFTTKKPNTTNSAQPQTTTTPTTNTQTKAYCPYCGKRTPPENVIYCPNCGKQQ